MKTHTGAKKPSGWSVTRQGKAPVANAKGSRSDAGGRVSSAGRVGPKSSPRGSQGGLKRPVSKRKAVSQEIDVRKAFAKAWAETGQTKASRDNAWRWYASGFFDGNSAAKAGFTEPRIRIIGKRRGQP